MNTEYSLKDLQQANLIVRNEYEERFKVLEKQIEYLERELSKISSQVKEPLYAIASKSTTVYNTAESTAFEDLSIDQLKDLYYLYNSVGISDWEKTFLDTIIRYQKVSPKQKEIVRKILLKVESTKKSS
jgi:hypothetical protein